MAVLAGLVGLAVGFGIATAIGGADPIDSPEYQALQTQLDSTTAALEQESAKSADIQDAFAKAQEERDGYKQQLDELQGRAAELDTREADIAAREKAMQEAEAAKNATSFGSGTHLVGTDIQPGRYRNDGESFCYWARLSGVSGDFSDLIANDNPDGPTVVDIQPTDVAFESARCGTWTKIG